MLKILLVDDDDALREKISSELSLRNFGVKCLSNGLKVISELKKEKYDLVITDIVMPDKEGLETIRDIRQINDSLPIIAVSGGGLTTASLILEMAELLGANGSLIKPFGIDSLIIKIEELNTRRR